MQPKLKMKAQLFHTPFINAKLDSIFGVRYLEFQCHNLVKIWGCCGLLYSCTWLTDRIPVSEAPSCADAI